ncbi:hypothetical protein [Acinetobacter bereziniae]|uniref:hypothetical protein n=1 Tax=Acinetobacter bereziniae TaxID=106648 RepID=UPI00124F8C0B|nr:hypothetical protein [Acinetobacter bereziniae]
MARLDVTSVLRDPRFMDKYIVCIRNTQNVNEKGRAENKQCSTRFSGVVTSNDGINIDRRPDGSIVSGAINIVTKFNLVAGLDHRDSDEICWKNKHYFVSKVDDYSHFGRGFIQAVCILKPFAGS